MPKQVPNPNWKDLALGGAVIEPGSAKYNRTGDWRSERPVWTDKRCVGCGVCSIFCPEGCITMIPDKTLDNERGYRPVTDLEYCKGCGICVVECDKRCRVLECIVMEEEKV